MRVVLPWPDKRLSPNARIHWRTRAELVKMARADAHFLTLEAAGYELGSIRSDLAGEDTIPLHFLFSPPDARHRDTDNIIASLKSAVDGIADALHVNDRRFVSTYTVCAPEKPGRVEVVVQA